MIWFKGDCVSPGNGEGGVMSTAERRREHQKREEEERKAGKKIKEKKRRKPSLGDEGATYGANKKSWK